MLNAVNPVVDEIVGEHGADDGNRPMPIEPIPQSDAICLRIS